MKDALSLSSFKPGRLLGQIVIVILAAVLLYHFAGIIIFKTLGLEGKRHYVSEADFVTGIFISLNGAPLPNRAEQANEIMKAAPYVRVLLTDEAPQELAPIDPVFEAELNRINLHLRGKLVVFSARWPEDQDRRQAISTRLPGGVYCVVGIDQEKKPADLIWRWMTDPEPAIPLMLTRLPRAILLYLIIVSILVFWVAKVIVGPIIRLSKEVRAVSLDGDYSMQISERGAEEIKDLTRSINEMHRKIFDMALYRRYAIVGLSHDLKTILTRLKLRVEFVGEESVKTKFERDFHLMEMMVERKLELLQAEGGNSDRVVIDLESLIDTVIEQFRECGTEITFTGASGVTVENSISDLFRIMANIISNAAKHARNIQVTVHTFDDDVIIDIADDGPGIADELKDVVFEPFVRGSPEQTLGEDAGFGLGLSIVKTLIRRQGGKILLFDNIPHGLLVRLTLPRRGSAT